MSLDQPAALVKHQTVTRDAFLGGRLTVSQPRHGFRAGLDSVLLGAAVVAGAQWLGTDSWLAPLFPAPGDSLMRYIVGTGILILLLPGGLMTLAATLRDTRARGLAIPLVIVAVLLIPLLLWTTQLTSTAPVERVW